MKNLEIPEGYTRVTEVLRPFSDFSSIDAKTLAKAADRGTRVHKYCELYARHLLIDDIDEDCKFYVNAFIEWYDEMIEETRNIELRLNSPDFRLSGQVDLIARLKGDDDFSIIDIKTPQVAQKSWRLQTAAYAMLANNCLGIRPSRRICLMLPRDLTKVKICEYEDHQKDIYLFTKALVLHRFFKG